MKYSRDYLEKIKNKIPSVAFELFTKKGIEEVSMQDIANKMKIGYTSLYRYYNKKSKLVIEIATSKWNEFYEEVEDKYKKMNGDKFSALEEIIFYVDSYIELYKNHKDFLKFTSYFSNYILTKKIPYEELKEFYKTVNKYKEKFHKGFIKKDLDHSIRTDLKEDEVFFGTMRSLLSTLERYALGTIYPNNISEYLNEIEMLKNAYINYLKPIKEE